MGLRICAYEPSYGPFLDEIAAAVERGVDVRTIDEHRDPEIFADSDRELAARNLTAIATPRATTKSAISHNKFIVKLLGDHPVSVWTGGTNFSESGIFGHSNVAQVVDDEAIADKYLHYWRALESDPTNGVLAPLVEQLSPLPAGDPPKGAIVLFSPRTDLAALKWYAARAQAAENGLFMSFAFGMNAVFQNVYELGTAH